MKALKMQTFSTLKLLFCTAMLSPFYYILYGPKPLLLNGVLSYPRWDAIFLQSMDALKMQTFVNWEFPFCTVVQSLLYYILYGAKPLSLNGVLKLSALGAICLQSMKALKVQIFSKLETPSLYINAVTLVLYSLWGQYIVTKWRPKAIRVGMSSSFSP